MSKQFILHILSVIVIAFSLSSCTSETKPTGEAAEDKAATNATETQTASSNPNREYLIENSGIEGILVGGFIKKIEDRTKPGQIKNSEGVFSTYHFASEDGNRIGYFLPDPQNERLIGDITINSPNAVTSHGIKVGSTFAELRAAVPNVVVHGSEIEGRTTAVVDNIGFRLRAAFHTYEVDEDQIEPDTRITQIVIMRQAEKK